VAAEKVVYFVIPSEARDLLSRKTEEKADSSGKPAPRNDRINYFFRSLFSRDIQKRENQGL